MRRMGAGATFAAALAFHAAWMGPTPSPAGASQAADLEDPDDGIVGRALVEGLGGVSLGVLGGLVGSAFGNPASIVGGVLLGVPLGVWVGGSIFGAEGSYWAALLGEAAGLIALAAALAAADPPGDEPVLIVVILAFPLSGAAVGYELSNDPDPDEGQGQGQESR